MPFTTFAFLIAALSIIGLPPFGGLWSKWYLAMGALDGDYLFIVAILMLSSLLNVAYLLPLPFRGFFSAPANNPAQMAIEEAPWPCLIAIGLTAMGCLALFFLSGPILELLRPIVAR